MFEISKFLQLSHSGKTNLLMDRFINRYFSFLKEYFYYQIIYLFYNLYQLLIISFVKNFFQDHKIYLQNLLFLSCLKLK